MDGVLNINKSAGPTSHDVVAVLRRVTGVRRIGHAGTLDPEARGVLVICMGGATRIVEYLMERPKTYRATAVLGTETDTEDHTGSVTAEPECHGLSREDVEAVLPRFSGEIMQVPPMVSAVHHDGRRLYELAREGNTVDRKPRPVCVHSLQLVDFVPGPKPEMALDIECSRGTYVRTLCADIGRALGCGGYMSSLVRTAVGEFRIEDALGIEQVEDAVARGTLRDLICSIDDALRGLPIVSINEADARLVVSGTAIPAERLLYSDAPFDAPLRMHDTMGRLLGIGMLSASPEKGAVLKPKKVFASTTDLGWGN